MSNKPILIVGSQGKTGSRVNARLNAAGIATRGVSRSSFPAFDWNQPDTWLAAIRGTRSAYVTYHPDLAVPEAAAHIAEFCRLAVQEGLAQVVLLSGRGEEGAAKAEAELRSSGLAWNIVKASWFAQNFSESFMAEGVNTGQLVLPMCSSAEPFVDLDDVADVVVASLLEPGLHNRLFEVTGPRLMTFRDCVWEIEQATGRVIELQEVPLNDYIAALAEDGVPSSTYELLRQLFNDLFDGRNATIASGVREALGRSPTDFRDYAKKSATTGAWPHNQKEAG